MSFAKRVHLPIVPVSMMDIKASKRRINKLLKRYKKEVDIHKDPAAKLTKVLRIEVLEEILNTYRIIEETI